MNEQHHGNVLGGAIGETTQSAAQLATIVATAAQTVVRMRASRLAADHARDQAAANVEPAVLRSEPAAARLAWARAFERCFPDGATAPEAAAAWAAARSWVDHDPTAHEAARRAEERLRAFEPEVMGRYQQGLDRGLDAVDAMVQATTLATTSPTDASAAAAARAVAGDERGEALLDAAVPDVAATALVDERTQGIHAGASHAAVSDAAGARAALLAAQAYPRPPRARIGDAVSPPARPVPRSERNLRR